jgi:hypothetical protein
VYKEFYPQGKADKFCAQVFSVFDADNRYINKNLLSSLSKQIVIFYQNN